MALPSGIVNTFTYNGDGLRVQKQDSGGTTKHVWDIENILLETDGSNLILVVYSLEPIHYGNLISQSRGGVDSLFLFNALGSTRQLASSSASVTDTYIYDSMGNALVSGTAVNPFTFLGRIGYYNESELSCSYVRVRYMIPSIGRFISQDLLNQGAGSSLYVYCDNNPVMLTDPSGLQPGVDFLRRAPVPGVCGRVSWPGRWAPRFEMKKAGKGFIVQRVVAEGQLWWCDRDQINSLCPYDYYEVWPVQGGLPQPPGTDTFSLPLPFAARGCINISGWAKFIPLDDTAQIIKNHFPR